MTIGSEHFAAFSEPKSGWVHANTVLDKYIISAVTEDHVTLYDPQTRKSHDVSLPTAEVQGATEMPTPQWIDSKENPMLASPTELPPEIRRDWKRLSESERSSIISSYARCGWKLIYTDAIWGGITFMWDNPLSDTHQATVHQQEAFFNQTLSDPARVLWNKIRGNQPVAPGQTAISSSERVAIEQRSEDIERLQSMLPPQQVSILSDLLRYTSPTSARGP